MASIQFFTLFDSRYAARGILMLESLEQFLGAHDEIVVLAMDDATHRLLAKIANPKWRAITLTDLSDAPLMEVQLTRPRREFFWTCTPALCAWMVRNGRAGDIVVYLDADLFFFADPNTLIDELSDGGKILIVEHRFTPDRIQWQPAFGRFNVSFVGFRCGTDEAAACVELWRGQTIECCAMEPEKGKCGDQGYLDQWPTLYPNLRILKNIGGGVAPWNVSQYLVGRNAMGPTVDGHAVIFYHYHALRTLADFTFGFVAVLPAEHYRFTTDALKQFYRPYAKRLWRATRRIQKLGFDPEVDRVVGRREMISGMRHRTYIHAF